MVGYELRIQIGVSWLIAAWRQCNSQSFRKHPDRRCQICSAHNTLSPELRRCATKGEGGLLQFWVTFE